jgi:hypothetical protein
MFVVRERFAPRQNPFDATCLLAGWWFVGAARARQNPIERHVLTSRFVVLWALRSLTKSGWLSNRSFLTAVAGCQAI